MSASTHPVWCAPELCTADRGEHGAQHRSDPITFTAPAVSVDLALFQPEPGSLRDSFMTAVVTADGTGRAGVTVSVSDAWRLVDAVTELLERVR